MNTEVEISWIASGYLAAFTLLDWDPLTIREDQIEVVSSVLTMMNGRVVFSTGDYEELSPALPDVLPAWSPVKFHGALCSVAVSA